MSAQSSMNINIRQPANAKRDTDEAVASPVDTTTDQQQVKATSDTTQPSSFENTFTGSNPKTSMNNKATFGNVDSRSEFEPAPINLTNGSLVAHYYITAIMNAIHAADPLNDKGILRSTADAMKLGIFKNMNFIINDDGEHSLSRIFKHLSDELKKEGHQVFGVTLKSKERATDMYGRPYRQPQENQHQYQSEKPAHLRTESHSYEPIFNHSFVRPDPATRTIDGPETIDLRLNNSKSQWFMAQWINAYQNMVNNTAIPTRAINSYAVHVRETNDHEYETIKAVLKTKLYCDKCFIMTNDPMNVKFVAVSRELNQRGITVARFMIA